MQIDLETRFGLLVSLEDRAWTDQRTLADLWGQIRSWNEFLVI
jgi:hypothetical protein